MFRIYILFYIAFWGCIQASVAVFTVTDPTGGTPGGPNPPDATWAAVGGITSGSYTGLWNTTTANPAISTWTLGEANEEAGNGALNGNWIGPAAGSVVGIRNEHANPHPGNFAFDFNAVPTVPLYIFFMHWNVSPTYTITMYDTSNNIIAASNLEVMFADYRGAITANTYLWNSSTGVISRTGSGLIDVLFQFKIPTGLNFDRFVVTTDATTPGAERVFLGISDLAVIPEPSKMLLLSFGVMSLLIKRKRCRFA
jgi:hypothetical protein